MPQLRFQKKRKTKQFTFDKIQVNKKIANYDEKNSLQNKNQIPKDSKYDEVHAKNNKIRIIIDDKNDKSNENRDEYIDKNKNKLIKGKTKIIFINIIIIFI